jgi:hypothetical protein
MSTEDLGAAFRGTWFSSELGAVVAFERRDGSMAMCSWAGETVAAWAKFDVEWPQELPISRMREHIVEAIPRGLATRPGPDFWAVICFKAPIRARRNNE